MLNPCGSAAAAFSRAQSGASTARRETKSATPDAPASREASAQALAATVAALVPAGREQDLADALVSCLNGTALQLTRLEASWRPFVYALPPEAWALLDRLGPEGGITTVDVPQADRSEDVPGLARGLAVLPALNALDLPVPRSGAVIDLSALHAAGRPQDLRLQCVRADAWQITVPAGCRVQAVGPLARQHHLLKPTVSYVDTAGHPTGERHALAGVPYLAKPPAWITEAFPGDTKAARRMALGLSTNGRAQFEDDGTWPAAQPAAGTIWCRHIAWKVGDDWQMRRGLQQIGRPVKMSYEPYSTPEALRIHVKPQTQANYRQDLAREAAAVFTDEGFGQAMQAQFESLGPGRERIFLLVTLNHAMTLELRRKGQHCIVTCYDPNVSTLPLKLLVSDPSHLRPYTLSNLLASRYPSYVPVGARVSGALFAFGAGDSHGGGPARLHGFDDDLLASREGLYWLLDCSVAGGIDRSVEAIVAANRDQDAFLLAARLSATWEGFNGMLDAVVHGHTDAADAYVQAVLRHALPVLGVEATAQVLRGPLLGATATVLHAGLDHNQDFIAAYVRRVLAVPGLDTAARIGLLALPGGRSLLEEALQYLPAASGVDDLPPRMQALTSILNAILTAPGLDAASRPALLAGLVDAGAWTRPFTERLEAGDPVPAAILLSACLNPESQGAVPIGSLGPALDVELVLAALHAQPDNRVAQRCAQWLASDLDARKPEG